MTNGVKRHGSKEIDMTLLLHILHVYVHDIGVYYRFE